MSLLTHAVSAPANQLRLLAMEIDHPELDEPLRYVRDTRGWTAVGAEYPAAGFTASAAGVDDSGIDSRQISVADPDRQLLQLLLALRAEGNLTPITVTLREFLSDDPATAVTEIELQLSGPSFDPQTLTFEFIASSAGYNLRDAPWRRFTSTNSQGLVR